MRRINALDHEKGILGSLLISIVFIIILILNAFLEGVTDWIQFFFRDYFSSTLSVSVVTLNAWLSYILYKQGIGHLEGFWRVETEVKDFHGEKDNYVLGEGEMYLTRTKTKNLFRGIIRLAYKNRKGETMFTGTYRAEMELRMNRPWSSEGDINGRTIMICRNPTVKNGHDSYVVPHTQDLRFKRKDLLLEGTSKIEGQEAVGLFKARRATP